MEKIYVMGGFQESVPEEYSIESYDLIECKWEDVAYLPFNRVKF